jgi:probable HAF family extracellular repeat protein
MRVGVSNGGIAVQPIRLRRARAGTLGLALMGLALLVAVLPAGRALAATPSTRLQASDLGTLGGCCSFATGINDRGEVVGYSDVAETAAHAFLWRRGTMTDLGTLGGAESAATAINQRGEVVGWSDTAAGERHAFRWRRGTMTDLGTLPGDSLSLAYGINDRGQVVGQSSSGPVRWQRGAMTRLASPKGATYGAAFDINNRGDIVGYAGFPSGFSINRAVLWRNGVVVDLGTPATGNSMAIGINDRRQIVGWSDRPDGSFGAFLWKRGTMTALRSLTGNGGQAEAINNRGQVAGSGPAPEDPMLTHAVLWR